MYRDASVTLASLQPLNACERRLNETRQGGAAPKTPRPTSASGSPTRPWLLPVPTKTVSNSNPWQR